MVSRFPARVPDNHVDRIDYGANAKDGHVLKSAPPIKLIRAMRGNAGCRQCGCCSAVWLVLKFRRHAPQPACDREIEGRSRHRNQYLGLPTQICGTDH
jgi:hypothetical protein